MKKRTFILVIFFLLSSYIGTGAYFLADLNKDIALGTYTQQGQIKSVEYEGVTFKNIQQVIELKRRGQLNSFFPWIFYVPTSLGIVITAFFAGVLGGIFQIMKNLAYEKMDIEKVPIYYILFFSGFLGLMLLSISFLSNIAIMVSNHSAPNPPVISFLAFMGGGFGEVTYNRVKQKWENF